MATYNLNQASGENAEDRDEHLLTSLEVAYQDKRQITNLSVEYICSIKKLDYRTYLLNGLGSKPGPKSGPIGGGGS